MSFHVCKCAGAGSLTHLLLLFPPCLPPLCDLHTRGSPAGVGVWPLGRHVNHGPNLGPAAPHHTLTGEEHLRHRGGGGGGGGGEGEVGSEEKGEGEGEVGSEEGEGEVGRRRGRGRGR